MKSFICVLISFAAFQGTLSAIYEPIPTSDVTNLDYVSRKIQARITIERVKQTIDAICPGYGIKLEGALQDVAKCGDSVDENSETVCSFIENHGRKCLSPITKLFEECLPENSKSIVPLVTNMSLSTIKHICGINGEQIFELGNECVMLANTRTQRCLRRTFTTIEQYKRSNTYPSASDICLDLKSLKPCFQSHLNQACGHPITRKAFTDMVDVWISVCDSYQSAEINEVEQLL